jgi:hypothetical protein
MRRVGLMRRSVTILIAILVVAGLVFGGYLYGRDHSPTTAHGSVSLTIPKTTIDTSPGPAPCGTNEACFDFTDKSGDGVTATLDGYMPVSNCATREVGGGSYLVAIAFTNTGTSILTTDGDSYESAVTLIDPSSTAYSDNLGGSCGYQNAPVAMSLCKNSAYILDLTPGASAIWCPTITFPANSTLEKIQFNATEFFSSAFTESGISNTVTWSVGSN